MPTLRSSDTAMTRQSAREEQITRRETAYPQVLLIFTSFIKKEILGFATTVCRLHAKKY